MSEINYGGYTAQELKVARAAGTKGKWDHSGGNATHCIHVERDGSKAICPHDVLVACGYAGKKYLPGVAKYADARLIVLAVNALPDLLARIEQLEAENGRLREALEGAKCRCSFALKLQCENCGAPLTAGVEQFEDSWICGPCNEIQLPGKELYQQCDRCAALAETPAKSAT